MSAHPCRAARDPLKGAALAARQSRFRGALDLMHAAPEDTHVHVQ